ncbi:MAG: transcriptional repressor [Cyanobacteria bacterium]|nr:transcriptional repressor [Cyanobacteriota bacterium]
MVQARVGAEAVVQTLKARGLRVTPQRCAVYANLLRRTDHPTVEQILNDLNRELPVSSKATVYSSLQALRDVGLVREVLLQEGVSRYDAKVEPHHHFLCDRCGAIHDLPWAQFGELSLSVLPQGLRGVAYEVTVRGTCGDCGGMEA